jgi:hypothetical protein
MSLRDTIIPTIKDKANFLWDKFRWWNSRASRIFISLLALFFVISCATLVLKPPLMTRLYLEYPSLHKGHFSGEVRYVPASFSTEARAETVMREILVGSSSLTKTPLFPPNTRLRSLLYRKGVVYADITDDVLLQEPSLSSYQAVFSKAGSILRHNLPWVRTVVITIEGNEIGMPSASPQKTKENAKPKPSVAPKNNKKR